MFCRKIFPFESVNSNLCFQCDGFSGSCNLCSFLALFSLEFILLLAIFCSGYSSILPRFW